MNVVPVRPVPPRMDPPRASPPSAQSVRDSGSAIVIAIDAETCLITTGEHPRRSRVAASCLLQPGPGDRVAWWRDEHEGLWITAVLTRAAGTPPSMLLPAETRIVTAQGSITMAPAASLRLEPGDALAVCSTTVSFATRAIDAVAEAVTASFGSTRLIGRLLRSIFERVDQHAGSHHRVVQGLDQLQAGTLDHRASGLAHLAGETVVVGGERLIKQRAAQIHMG